MKSENYLMQIEYILYNLNKTLKKGSFFVDKNNLLWYL